MTQWLWGELEVLEQAWASVTKRAWGLTLGQDTAPFRLSKMAGGIGRVPAATLQAKEVTGLLDLLRACQDGEVT